MTKHNDFSFVTGTFHSKNSLLMDAFISNCYLHLFPRNVVSKILFQTQRRSSYNFAHSVGELWHEVSLLHGAVQPARLLLTDSATRTQDFQQTVQTWTFIAHLKFYTGEEILPWMAVELSD